MTATSGFTCSVGLFSVISGSWRSWGVLGGTSILSTYCAKSNAVDSSCGAKFTSSDGPGSFGMGLIDLLPVRVPSLIGFPDDISKRLTSSPSISVVCLSSFFFSSVKVLWTLCIAFLSISSVKLELAAASSISQIKASNCDISPCFSFKYCCFFL